MSETPLTPTRLHRLRALFDAAIELPVGERAAYLASACENDPTLQTEVEELLAAVERSGDTWDHPVGAAVAGAMAEGLGEGARRDRYAAGGRIGVYEITRLIGMGGMGAVYEGVRVDDQFRKRVALKFLRRGGEGDLAIRRFRYERQILANLNHRNIAALLDGGVTEDGQPYIVMEYVEGEPLTTYANTRRLDLRGRVALLRQVCAAVQHAHQNFVVHRSQTGQHSRHGRRQREAARFRHCAAHTRRRGLSSCRPTGRRAGVHAGVCQSRTGARHAGGRVERHLFARGHRCRTAVGRATYAVQDCCSPRCRR